MKKQKIGVENRNLIKAFGRVYREEARIEQRSKCVYCYEPLTFKTATADHIKPKSKNGLDRKDNIAACCFKCNQLKGSMSVNQFKNIIKSFPSGMDIQYILTWSRRKLNIATDRAEKNISRFMGWKIDA